MKVIRKALFWILVLGIYGLCAYWLLTPVVTEVVLQKELELGIQSFEEKTEWARKQYNEYLKENSSATNMPTNISQTHPNSMEEPAPVLAKTQIPYKELRDAMISYNEAILSKQASLIGDVYDYAATPIDPRRYGLEDEIVGTLYLPGMEKTFPVYLGASNEHLSKGVCQIAYTSMPVGGVNNNIVLAGHRGWNNGKFLKNIEDVELGSVLVLTTPWEKLYYRAVDTSVIYPHDVSQTMVQPGRDLLTVLTCHPYGTGGLYRYLLICERCDAPEPVLDDDSVQESEKETTLQPEKNQTVVTDITPQTEDQTGKQGGKRAEHITIDFVSSKAKILIDDTLRTIGLIALALIPFIYILICKPFRKRKKRSAD